MRLILVRHGQTSSNVGHHLDTAAPGADLLPMVKPQFEAGPGETDRGVVRDPAVHARVCSEMRAWMEAQAGWRVLDIMESPIRGPEGNIENLLTSRREG